jgi:hypothetical protein
MVLLPIMDLWNVMINKSHGHKYYNHSLKYSRPLWGLRQNSGENIKMYVTDIHMYILKI